MVVVAPDKRRSRLETEDGRLRFYSWERGKKTGAFAYDTWANMSTDERDWYRRKWPEWTPPADDDAAPIGVASPAVSVPSPVRQEYNRFTRQRDSFLERADQLESQANVSGDNDRYGRLLNDAAQFRLAADLLREAENVEPGADVTFGYAPNYGMSTRLPPAVSGYEIYEPIRIPLHTYRTNDPVRIAWLRRLIRERADDNLSELPSHDLDAAVSPNGELMGWFPRSVVADIRAAGGARKAGT